MADRHDLEAHIKLTSDLSGGVQTREELYKLKQFSNQLEKETKKSGDGVVGAMGRMKGSIEKVRGAMMSLGGLATIVTGLVAAFKSWQSASNEVAAEIENIHVEAAKKTVEELAAAEKKVADEIARGKKAREDSLSLDKQRLDAARELADAELENQKALEIAAVKEGPDKDLELKRIENKYAGIRGARTEDRAKEDLESEARAKREEADMAEREAKRLAAARDEQAEIAKDERRAANKSAAAASKAAGRDSLWKFWSDGADVAALKTEESKAHGAVAESAQAKADEYDRQIQEANDRAKRLRDEASVADSRVKATIVRKQTQSVTGQTEADSVSREQEKRDNERKAKAEQELRDKALIASAPAKEADLKAREKAEKQRLSDAELRKNSELADAELARERLKAFDAASQGGGRHVDRKEREALVGDVNREEQEARAAVSEFEKVKSSVVESLKGLVSDMKKLEADVRNAKSRQKVAQEGD